MKTAPILTKYLVGSWWIEPCINLISSFSPDISCSLLTGVWGIGVIRSCSHSCLVPTPPRFRWFGQDRYTHPGKCSRPLLSRLTPGIKTRPDTSICDFITMKLLLSKLKFLILPVKRKTPFFFSLVLLLLLYLLHLLSTEILDMSEFQQKKLKNNNELRWFWISQSDSGYLVIFVIFLEIDFTGAVILVLR